MHGVNAVQLQRRMKEILSHASLYFVLNVRNDFNKTVSNWRNLKTLFLETESEFIKRPHIPIFNCN